MYLMKILPLNIKAILRVILGKAVLSETEIIYKLFDYSTTSQTMIDVGAHHGGALAPFLFDGWQIHAFEPDINNRKKLQNYFGEYANIIIDPRAISNNIEKNVSFYESDVSAGISTLTPFHSTHKEIIEKIDVTTLKSYCNNENIKKIDFLKIDVEGYDLFVLQGFPWSEILPEVILVEYENKKTIPLGYTFHDMALYLMDKGYYLLVSEWDPIKEYGSVHTWKRFIQYPCELLDKESFGNIFAIRNIDLFNKLLNISNNYYHKINKIKKIRLT